MLKLALFLVFSSVAAACYNTSDGTKMDAQRFFAAADQDGDGTVSKDEFIRIIDRESSIMVQREMLIEQLEVYDMDGDGTLRESEFMRFVEMQIEAKTPPSGTSNSRGQ